MADPLVTAREAQAFIRSDLNEAELQAVLNREEARLVAKLGPHGDGVTEITVTLFGSGGDLYLPRPAVSVASVGGTSNGLTVYADQGRILGSWSGEVTVIYVPTDDTEARRQAIIDLARLSIQRTAFQSESVAGEHSYSAPKWEEARAAIYRSLMFISI